MRPRHFAAVLATGAALALAAGWIVAAQPAGSGSQNQAAEPSSPTISPAVPVIEPPTEPAAPPTASAPSQSDNAVDEEAATNRPAPKPEVAAKPPPPPMPVRSPAAILQVLDKVTAETMRFAAPVGQRVRYKNLVFTVKACETTGLSDPSPAASAYLVVDSQPPAIQGHAPPPAKQIFHGWMFAKSPGLDPLQHPVYDAWLITCIAAVPPA